MKHGSKIKYAGHFFMHEKSPHGLELWVMHKIMNAPEGQTLQRDIKL